MAFPVITFDRDAGSDTNDASGAGPATAIVGIKARTRGAGGTRIGFFETSNPNLSGIAVDGSNALKLGTSSGRQWTKITAKKDMAQAFTADAAASSDTLTNVSSQAGLTIGDVIKVPGAGAASADLYVTILDLPTSTSIQMNTTASTNQTTAACVDPKQVTVEDSFTLTSDIAWACGGKRGDLAAGEAALPAAPVRHGLLEAPVVAAVAGDAAHVFLPVLAPLELHALGRVADAAPARRPGDGGRRRRGRARLRADGRRREDQDQECAGGCHGLTSVPAARRAR